VGQATVTADAGEGTPGSATIDVADSPPPPPPPGAEEPIYNAATNTELFFDDFEVYSGTSDLVTWQSHYSDRWIELGSGQTTLQTDGANKRMRSLYRGGGGDQQRIGVETTRGWSASNGSSLVYTFEYRPMNGYQWAGEGGNLGAGGGRNKWFLTNIKKGGLDRTDMIIGQEPQVPSLSPAYPSPPRTHFSVNVSGNNWQQNMDMSVHPNTINDGNWHRITMRQTWGSSRGRDRIEMWVDGVKVMEHLGDDPSRAEYNKVSLPSPSNVQGGLHFPANRDWNPPSDHWLEYDNVRIWRP
jgi:hypothetical protein